MLLESMKDWESAYRDYLSCEKRYSQETAKVYLGSLCSFSLYVQRVCPEADLDTIGSNVVRGWLMSLMDEGYKAVSVNKNLSALKNFYRYLKLRQLIDKNPASSISGLKKEKTLPIYVREQDMQQVLSDSDDGDFEAIRDKLIIELFYATGIRRAELLGLKYTDIDLFTGAIKVTGKRNKQRVVPFAKGLQQHIEKYMSARDTVLMGAEVPAFFVRATGKPIDRRDLARIVSEQLAFISALKKRSPHVLRHTFATAMLNNGADINSVKELLGHANLSATEIYTHLTFEQLKNIYNQAHPRA